MATTTACVAWGCITPMKTPRILQATSRPRRFQQNRHVGSYSCILATSCTLMPLVAPSRFTSCNPTLFDVVLGIVYAYHGLFVVHDVVRLPWGCSLHPIPDDLSTENTFRIVNNIRCEVKDQVQLRLQELLNKSPDETVRRFPLANLNMLVREQGRRASYAFWRVQIPPLPTRC